MIATTEVATAVTAIRKIAQLATGAADRPVDRWAAISHRLIVHINQIQIISVTIETTTTATTATVAMAIAIVATVIETAATAIAT